MFFNIKNKIQNNINVYKNDLKTKGLYWSVVHRIYKIPKMRLLLMPIVNFLKPDYVLVDGLKLYIDKEDDTISQQLVQNGKWEEFETEVFKNKVKKRDVVVDVGAHIGYYTLIASKKVGADGSVYAFEPDPRNFLFLEKNVKVNNLKNVILINKAVADKTGSAKLYINRTNTGDHSIFNIGHNRKSINISTVSLNDYFRDIKQKINVIKLDVQGSEIYALKGARKLIERNNRMVIITEFWPHAIRLGGASPLEYIRFLRQFKFRIELIDEFEQKLKAITSDNALLTAYPENAGGVDRFTNLLCERIL